jgi:hypothetical protein
MLVAYIGCWFIIYGYITMHGQQNFKSDGCSLRLEHFAVYKELKKYNAYCNWRLYITLFINVRTR